MQGATGCAILTYVTAPVTPILKGPIMRTVIAVDLNTMRELADEETRVRLPKANR